MLVFPIFCNEFQETGKIIISSIPVFIDVKSAIYSYLSPRHGNRDVTLKPTSIYATIIKLSIKNSELCDTVLVASCRDSVFGYSYDEFSDIFLNFSVHRRVEQVRIQWT